MRAGVSDDVLQAIVETIKRMTIVTLKRFTKNLQFLMSTPFDDPWILQMPLLGLSPFLLTPCTSSNKSDTWYSKLNRTSPDGNGSASSVSAPVSP